MIVSQKEPKKSQSGYSLTQKFCPVTLRQRVAGSVTRQILFFLFQFFPL